MLLSIIFEDAKIEQYSRISFLWTAITSTLLFSSFLITINSNDNPAKIVSMIVAMMISIMIQFVCFLTRTQYNKVQNYKRIRLQDIDEQAEQMSENDDHYPLG